IAPEKRTGARRCLISLNLFFFFLPSPPAPVRCSRPKDVANAHIDVDDNMLLNTRLRYTCNPGYKRKAGTSSLIQCILPEGSSEPDWTQTTLKCIRKPSLGSSRSFPTEMILGFCELIPLHEMTMPDRNLKLKGFTPFPPAGSTDTNPTSSPSPAAAPGLPGAASQSPVPPAPDGPPPELSMPPETPPALETPIPEEGTAQGTSLGTTPLPPTPMDHAAGQATSPTNRAGFNGQKLFYFFNTFFPCFQPSL
uniref:Sushi domain-containing protein n=1 Tax=Strix occidentalis caurina TaxID=311401 RepID=A0A8D0EHW2_STROC